MKKSVQDVVFFFLLLLWPLELLLLFLAGARLWEGVQKPILRAQVAARLGELTVQAEEGQLDGDAYGGVLWHEVSGFGLGPSARYYGYCYSPDGDPHPYAGMEGYDEIPVMFGFRWEEPGGDNGCYLEHIGGNFYYYKLWF